MSDQKNTEIKKENIFINFFKKNKKYIFYLFLITIIVLFIVLFINIKKDRENIKISENFIKAEILIKKNKKDEAKEIFEKIIKSKNIFYSPMALSEIIEHELSGIQEIANYYDIIISIRGLDREKKDLFKLKKIISTSSFVSQKEVINQIEQLIEEETIWRNVAFKFLINYLEGIGEVKKAEKYKILMKN